VGGIQSFQDLIAWQQTYKLGLRVYQIAAQLPIHEKYGLASQLRRGAISVASNIAEGYGRGSKQDYIRFLKIARGALFELRTQLMFARDFSYLTQEDFSQVETELIECERILTGLIRSLDQ